jgi:hypothetical protein
MWVGYLWGIYVKSKWTTSLEKLRHDTSRGKPLPNRDIPTVVKRGGLKNIHHKFNDGFYSANVSVVYTDGRKTVEKCRGNVNRIKIIIKLAMNVFQTPPFYNSKLSRTSAVEMNTYTDRL